MEIRNRTPYAFAPLMGRVNFPAHTATLTVKAGFRIVPGGTVEPLDKQPDLEGDVPSAAERPECLYAADLAQFKPRADLLLRAVCHTPGQKGLTACNVRFRVGDWKKELAVIGNRRWEKGLVFSKMSEPELFTRVDLTWGNAFGGEKFALNPAGKGRKDGLLPNVEYPDELIKSPGNQPTPAGFGPIDRTWKQRSSKLGTCDKKWLKERWPAFPKDFDWTHFNAAPEDQQLEGFLRGDEEIELLNMHPQHDQLTTRLPSLRVRVLLREGEPAAVREVPMNLDTLYVDAEKLELILTWRGIANVSDSDWEECREILIAQEPLGENRELEQLLPLFEEPGEEAEVEEAEEPEVPREQKIKIVEDQIKRAEQLALEQERAVFAQVQKQLGADEAKKLIGGAKAEVSSLEALVNKYMSGQVAKDAVKGSDFSPAALDPRKDPELAKAIKALDKPVPKPPADKTGLSAMLKSGEAGGGDFSGADASGEDLSGADLRDTYFNGANLAGAKLAGAKLNGASLMDANLEGADLTEADLSEADLTGANLAGAKLTGAILNEAVLINAQAPNASFDGAQGASVLMLGLKAAGASFKGAELAESVFSNATVEQADFSGAQLKDAAFDGVLGAGANFEGAQLAGFRGGEASDFTGANFQKAQAEGCVFERSTLIEADFRGANLKAAQFMFSDLTGAKLYGADLAGSMLRKAKLAKAEAGNANFFQAQLEAADLSNASLVASNFYEAEFLDAKTEGADFAGANLKMTKLA